MILMKQIKKCITIMCITGLDKQYFCFVGFTDNAGDVFCKGSHLVVLKVKKLMLKKGK